MSPKYFELKIHDRDEEGVGGDSSYCVSIAADSSSQFCRWCCCCCCLFLVERKSQNFWPNLQSRVGPGDNHLTVDIVWRRFCRRQHSTPSYKIVFYYFDVFSAETTRKPDSDFLPYIHVFFFYGSRLASIVLSHKTVSKQKLNFLFWFSAASRVRDFSNWNTPRLSTTTTFSNGTRQKRRFTLTTFH